MSVHKGEIRLVSYGMTEDNITLEVNSDFGEAKREKIIYTFPVKSLLELMATFVPIVAAKDTGTLVDTVMKQTKKESQQRRKGTQWTLGELIDALESLGGVDDDCDIFLDFGPTPMCLGSWRGSYDELSLEWTQEWKWEERMQFPKFLQELKSAVGRTFTGYKGGDYRMDRDTPVWVSRYGDATSCAVCGIENAIGADGNIYRITINTMHLEY